MRTIFLLFVIIFGLVFVSCQQKPTITDDHTTPDTSVTKSDQESVQPFEDTATLFNGRALLITHMTQVENLSVPQVNAWEPDGSYLEDEWQIYQFKSDAWTITLAKLQAETDPTLFRARVTGPSDFIYVADIYGDGTVSPAQ